MPILIAVVAVLVLVVFALGGGWSSSDEAILFVAVAVVVALFLVLFFLPYLQEFNRSEASRKRVRQFRKKGRKYALQAITGAVVLALLAVWWFRDVPQTVAPTNVTAAAAKELHTEPDAKPSVSPVSAPTIVAGTAESDIQNAIAGWTKAWSDGDVEAYLAAYAPGFVPADGATRKAWEVQRRQRVDKGRGIVVKVRDIRVESADANRAKVIFVQQYSARGLTDLSNKTLSLERQNGQWRITRETAVAIPKTE